MLATGAAAQPPLDLSGAQRVVGPSRRSSPISLGLASTPEAEFGGAAGGLGDTFDQGSPYLQVLPLNDGGWLILDGNRYHILDQEGNATHVGGARGHGPGEYMSLVAACELEADTLVVFDPNQRRLSFLTASGRFVRSVSVGTLGSLYPGACLSDGTLMMARSTITQQGRLAVRLTRIDRSGRTISVFGDLDVAPASPVARPRVSIFGLKNRLIVASGTRSELLEISAGGQVLRILGTRDQGDPLGAREREVLLEAALPLNLSGADRRRALDRLRAMPKVDRWPAYGRVMADAAGSLWVEDFASRGSSELPAWTRFSPEWRITGRLKLPPCSPTVRCEVAAFGRGTVVILQRHDDGVALFSVFRIEALRTN
jgi:hypothetical protein